MKEWSTLGEYSAIKYFMLPAGGIGEDPDPELFSGQYAVESGAGGSRRLENIPARLFLHLFNFHHVLVLGK